MRIMLLGLLAATFAGGCATPYQPLGFRGGYEDVQLRRDVFEVYFQGNGNVDAGEVYTMARLRGAELCRSGGFEWMEMLDDKVGLLIERNHRHARTVSNTYLYRKNGNGRVGGASTYTTHRRARTTIIEKPRRTISFLCTDTEPKRRNGHPVYNVALFIRTAGAHHGVE